MFEKIKTKIKENPETTKKVAIAGGVLIGVTAVALVIHYGNFEMPFNVPSSNVEVPQVIE